MGNRLRTFVAVELSREIAGKIAVIQEELRGIKGRISWVKPESSHLTLRFLGGVEEGKIEDIHRALLHAVACIHPFTVVVRGVGAFPSLTNPRVIWLGVEGGEQLGVIYERLEDELESIGFKREERGFHPHITVGRVRHIARKRALVEGFERFREVEVGSLPVRRVLLFRSDLRPSGALYTMLREARLGE
ncbi:MAG: RNA 2',3'-cyclic phosphodiesterase [Thermodesulfobacteriota bacterium]